MATAGVGNFYYPAEHGLLGPSSGQAMKPSRPAALAAGPLGCRRPRKRRRRVGPGGISDATVALFLETPGAAGGDVAPTEGMSAMGDPLELRDDACWACIIRKLRKANHEVLAQDLRAVLESPTRQDAMATFQARNPDYQVRTAPAAETCRFAGRCRW
jgi:hypothetical protein